MKIYIAFHFLFATYGFEYNTWEAYVQSPAAGQLQRVLQGYAQYRPIQPTGNDTPAPTSASWSELLVGPALYIFCKFVREAESKGQAGPGGAKDGRGARGRGLRSPGALGLTRDAESGRTRLN